MKVYTKIIKACDECPDVEIVDHDPNYCGFFEHTDESAYCLNRPLEKGRVLIGRRQTRDLFTIPPECPLKDAPQ